MPRSFVAHDTKAVSSFARQTMHQPPGVFVSKAGRFTSAVTDDGPFFFSQVACHRIRKCGQECPRLRSLTFEFSFAFFQKRLYPFVLVLARKAKRKQIDFAPQAFVHI